MSVRPESEGRAPGFGPESLLSTHAEIECRVRSFLDAGRREEAMNLLAAHFVAFPDDYELRCLQGLLFQQSGHYRDAESCYEAAAQIAPPSLQLFHNLGLVKLELGDLVGARKYLAEASAIDPDAVEPVDALASACLRDGDLPGALVCYERLLKRNPHHIRAYLGMAEAFSDAGWDEDAERSFSTVLSIDPDNVEALNGMGIICKRLGQYERALQFFDRAIALHPDEPALLRNKGQLFGALGRNDEAIACFRQILVEDPADADAHFSLACAYLISGRLPEGWQEYEYRWYSKERNGAVKMPDSRLPRWSGQAVVKADSGLVIYAEQGFGDGIQFVRYLPLVVERFSKVLLQTRKPLLSLFRRSFGQCVEVVADLPAEAGYSHYCPLLSLPLAFSTDLTTIPSKFPYLRTDPERVVRWRERLAGERRHKVGIVWATGKRGVHKRSFELTPALLKPLFSVADVCWINLNKEPIDSEQKEILAKFRVYDWSAELADFDDTAALIDALDLVISVDTAVAHLAGALDKPVWLLNRAESEWRWLLDRSDSPWYRSMRIFRQQYPRQWDKVVLDVADALTDWVADN